MSGIVLLQPKTTGLVRSTPVYRELFAVFVHFYQVNTQTECRTAATQFGYRYTFSVDQTLLDITVSYLMLQKHLTFMVGQNKDGQHFPARSAGVRQFLWPLLPRPWSETNHTRTTFQRTRTCLCVTS